MKTFESTPGTNIHFRRGAGGQTGQAVGDVVPAAEQRSSAAGAAHQVDSPAHEVARTGRRIESPESGRASTRRTLESRTHARTELDLPVPHQKMGSVVSGSGSAPQPGPGSNGSVVREARVNMRKVYELPFTRGGITEGSEEETKQTAPIPLQPLRLKVESPGYLILSVKVDGVERLRRQDADSGCFHPDIPDEQIAEMLDMAPIGRGKSIVIRVKRTGGGESFFKAVLMVRGTDEVAEPRPAVAAPAPVAAAPAAATAEPAPAPQPSAPAPTPPQAQVQAQVQALQSPVPANAPVQPQLQSPVPASAPPAPPSFNPFAT
jgi:hypothetical protein